MVQQLYVSPWIYEKSINSVDMFYMNNKIVNFKLGYKYIIT